MCSISYKWNACHQKTGKIHLNKTESKHNDSGILKNYEACKEQLMDDVQIIYLIYVFHILSTYLSPPECLFTKIIVNSETIKMLVFSKSYRSIKF